jgi:hypothetical protein
MQQEVKYNPCGGCGATEPIQRCIGCFHPFYRLETPMSGMWVNLKGRYTEDWQMMHCRYVQDGVILDTYLFEEKDGGLIKKGGTGRLEIHEVEYLVESNEQPEQKENDAVAKLVEFTRDCAENWDCDPDSHTYNLPCRKCEAGKLYNEYKKQK